MESLQLLVKKACEMFKDDALAPSVVTSWLESKGTWYVSIVRWRGTRKEMTRQVLFGVNDTDLENAYKEAMRRLL